MNDRHPFFRPASIPPTGRPRGAAYPRSYFDRDSQWNQLGIGVLIDFVIQGRGAIPYFGTTWAFASVGLLSLISVVMMHEQEQGYRLIVRVGCVVTLYTVGQATPNSIQVIRN